MPFPSRDEYERLLYTLPQRYPGIVSSTVHLYTTSRSTAIVRGSVHFRSGLELRIHEIVDFVAGCISDYSYTVLRGEERIRWYDPQPHPDNPDLAETFPHHFHAPPNIKRNRKPAAGISFTEPNLLTLIADCVALGTGLAGEPPAEGDQGPS
ncbi:MAG: DUF6516 family protein [Anaerolineae bacterium]